MILNFKIIGDIKSAIKKNKTKIIPKAVIEIDKNHVATFKRLTQNNLSQNEFLLNFKYLKRSKHFVKIRLSTNSYFFQEGEGTKFEKAKYGEFRVDEKGEHILTKLLDKEFNKL